MKAAVKILAFVPLAMLCACTNSNTAGSTTETENAIARGDGVVSIYVKDGKKAAKASYRILPDWFTADTSGTAIEDSLCTYVGETDSAGRILIEDHPEGSFAIEIEHGDSAIAFTYTLNNALKEFKVEKANLEKRGAVKGSVSLPEGFAHAWVHVPGIGRVEKSDSLGNFLIEDLPAGSLPLISWNEKTNEVIAKTDVEIIPGDTVNLGLVSATNEPIVKHVMQLHASWLIASWMRPLSIPFVLVYRLSGSNFDFSTAKGDGSDIHLYRADGSEVPIEVDTWDSVLQKATINIRLERASDTAATWNMEWGDPRVEPSPKTDIWKGLSDSLKYALNSVEIFHFENKQTLNDLPSPLTQKDWYVQKHVLDTKADTLIVTTNNAADYLTNGTNGRGGTVVHIEYEADLPDMVVFGTRLTDHPHDWSRLDSIVVWLRGNGEYEIILENLDEEKNYKASYKGEASDSWQRVMLQPEDFTWVLKDYHGWEVTRDKITHFTIFGYNGTELWIDNVRLYGINRDDLR